MSIGVIRAVVKPQITSSGKMQCKDAASPFPLLRGTQVYPLIHSIVSGIGNDEAALNFFFAENKHISKACHAVLSKYSSIKRISKQIIDCSRKCYKMW